MEQITLTTQASNGYALLDSGREEKLERYGDIVLARPDPQALWEKSLAQKEWGKAQGRYVREGRGGRWEGSLPERWEIAFGSFNFVVKPTSFKHVGLFPEQLPNWEWLQRIIKSQPTSASVPSVLNLFAYTGGATLAAATAGASVVHLDASKTAVAWARENATASGLAEKPVRWIVEDVLTFIKREIRRGNRYDVIIMDPPSFGHGPKDELWKIEENFLPLVAQCMELLSDKPLGFLVNGYAAGYSPLAFAYNLEPLVRRFGGTLQYGELTIGQEKGSRSLPCGIFARWEAN